MKDNQFEGKSLKVAAGTMGVLKLAASDIAFLDKKYVIVSGIAIAKVSVLVGIGETNIDLTDFNAAGQLVMTSGTVHIINVPMPTNNLAVSVDNTAGQGTVYVMFYGGSA